MGLGMPDLITAAFNQAVQPYTEKIEQLESQLADMQNWVDQLEQQRAEVHNWIDKRGLRPGKTIVLPAAPLCTD
jgi:prefoldin subunit 5